MLFKYFENEFAQNDRNDLCSIFHYFYCMRTKKTQKSEKVLKKNHMLKHQPQMLTR